MFVVAYAADRNATATEVLIPWSKVRRALAKYDAAVAERDLP
jgi:hypothetical protein